MRKPRPAAKIDPSHASTDKVVEKVIRSQAEIKVLHREIAALRKDRDTLLEEYHDIVNARPVPKPVVQKRRNSAKKKDTVLRVCVGDVHGMMMDTSAVGAFLRDMKIIVPDEIVLGGDIIECGGWLAKHQTIGYVSLTNYTYQEDISAAEWFLDQLQTICPAAKIHYIEGNHEQRIERWIVDQTMSSRRDSEFLRDIVGPPARLRLKERGIKWYTSTDIHCAGAPRGWVKLGRMFFTHALSVSKNAARDSLSKAVCNITYFHTHREDTATLVTPGTGIVKAFNPGCLCSMQPVWKRSDPTTWSQGYGLDTIARSGNFHRQHIPIWRGESLADAMLTRFKS